MSQTEKTTSEQVKLQSLQNAFKGLLANLINTIRTKSPEEKIAILTAQRDLINAEIKKIKEEQDGDLKKKKELQDKIDIAQFQKQFDIKN